MCILCHHCSCSYDRVLPYDTSVHYNTPHPYQHIILYGTSMNYSIVPNRYVISDMGSKALIGAMNYSAILNVYFIPQADCVYIASNYSIKPYTTVISCDHISNNCSVLGYINVCSKFRGLPIDCFNYHKPCF